MNKKFTMVCASLLLTSAFAVNAAALNTAKQANFAEKTEVKEGLKFYLGSNTTSSYTAYSVKTVKTSDGKEVQVLGANDQVVGEEASKAVVLEIRSLKTIGNKVQFELYTADGQKIYATKAGSNDVSTTKFADLVSSFYITNDDNKLTVEDIKEVKTVVYAEGGSEIATGAKIYTSNLTYTAAELNDYNSASTTFSFDFTDEELVGNEFKEVTPVTISASGVYAEGTYFVKGAKADVEKFVKEQTEENAKKISFLAVDKNHRYQLNASQSSEGYALYWMKGANIFKENISTADSLKNAVFTNILEEDQLNKEEVLTLTMGNTSLGKVNVAAVKTSASDTKAYVTTVSENSSWNIVKNAQLGANTYFEASEFLKKDAMNTVAILVVNGVPGADKYYHYVISTGAGDNAERYKSASELDFTMAQNQWIVAGFDGKYTVTLQNRLSGQTLELRLTKTENGYSVNPSSKGLEQVVINDKNEKENAVIKLLPVKTTATDGYLTLTDEQIKEGIKLSFSGKTDLAGEKEFFGVKEGEGNNAEMVPSLEAKEIITFYPERALSDDKKADKYTKPVTYAYLDANGEVKTTEAKANLVVPTYTLVVKRDNDGNITEKLDADYSVNDAANSHVFAFAKNMAGNYSLVAIDDAAATVQTIANEGATGVRYNTGSDADSKGLAFAEVSRYEADAVNNVFANVNVLPNVVLNPSFPAQSGHFTFDNERGSINVTDIKGINEGALSSEGMVFWLDSADTELDTPSFYISYGIKGDETARQYMFNPADSAKVFNTNTAKYDYNEVYFYGEDATLKDDATLKAAFTKATQEEGKDLADQFKFNITLADNSDEYILTTVSKGLNGETLAVAQKNGVVILVDKDNEEIKPMTFAVNPAEAPTSNEAVSTSEIKVIAQNGSIVVKNAAGKNVVVSTILGQIVANEVLTSDNATVNVPAGIVVVSVDGESFKVNVK